MRTINITMGLAGLAFGVTLAFSISQQLSEQVLVFISGAACGAGALLPATAVLLAMLLRRNGSAVTNTMSQAPSEAPAPQVVVVAPPASQATAIPLPAGQGWAAAYPYPQDGNRRYEEGYTTGTRARQFSIIGSDGEEILEYR